MKKKTNTLKGNKGILLLGIFLTSIGDGMHLIALGKVLFDLTGNVSSFAFVIILDFALSIFLQFLIGPFIDNKDSRKICILSDVVRGGILVACGVALLVQESLLLLFIMVILVKIVSQFFRSSIFSVIGAYVENREQVSYNGLSTIFQQTGQIVGVIIVGMILTIIPPSAVFIIDGATFIMAGLLLLLLKGEGNINKKVSSSERDSTSKLKFVILEWRKFFIELSRAKDGKTSHILISSFDITCISFINIALIPIVANRFRDESIYLSLFDGGFAVGAVVAGLIVSRLMRSEFVAVSFLLQSMIFFILSSDNGAFVTTTAYFSFGFLTTCSLSFVIGKLQARSEISEKGKIASLRNIITAIVSTAFLLITTYFHNISLSTGLLSSSAIMFFMFAYSLLAKLKIKKIYGE
ncbi:MFS transporter [Vibrio vulnificus]|uniref:MFS transporter n=1 Tax=Vibrio vulnificus TaxID=672 RepID=UPI001EEA3038|nr:MFS transporter [Vibrio vulnificus]MCG6313285.1 MFS transporter [Vibrio vulnificus]